jgi:vacuolar-type H+-ATPase subunit C/Vma6
MPDDAWFLRIARAPEQQLPGMIREHYSTFESVENLFEFEKGLEAERAGLVDLLTALISDRKAVTFLRAGYDFDNFTNALKGKFTGGAPVLLPFGMVGVETVTAAVERGDSGPLPDYLKDLSEKLLPLAEAGKIDEMDYLSTRLKFGYLFETAPTDGAREWVSLKIDRLNLASFMRLRRTGLRRNITVQTWVHEGSIESSRLAVLFKEPVEDFISYLSTTRWRGILNDGFQAGMDLEMVDAILDKHLLALTGDNRYRFFDLLPVLYHIDLRERNEKLLRMIIVFRINRVPEEFSSRRVEALVS